VSDERLQELRIPRRKFLKRAAATAFIAPVVVSFGLDGVAEASPGQFCANQRYSNQFTSLESDLTSVIYRTVVALGDRQIEQGPAQQISQQAYECALAAADSECVALCGMLAQLVGLIERLPNGGLKNELLSYVHSAQNYAGCGGSG